MCLSLGWTDTARSDGVFCWRSRPKDERPLQQVHKRLHVISAGWTTRCTVLRVTTSDNVTVGDLLSVVNATQLFWAHRYSMQQFYLLAVRYVHFMVTYSSGGHSKVLMSWLSYRVSNNIEIWIVAASYNMDLESKLQLIKFVLYLTSVWTGSRCKCVSQERLLFISRKHEWSSVLSYVCFVLIDFLCNLVMSMACKVASSQIVARSQSSSLSSAKSHIVFILSEFKYQ